MLNFLSALLLAIIPNTGPVVDHVDHIELNHCYNAMGDHVFDQVIFYNNSYDKDGNIAELYIVDWRLAKNKHIIPTKSHKSNKYVIVWQDGNDSGILRKVTSNTYNETWTQYDPELMARDKFPPSERIKLSRQLKDK